MVVELLTGDRYKLKAVKGKQTLKYSYEFLRSIPEKGITSEHEYKGVNGNDANWAGEGSGVLYNPEM